MSTIAFDGTIIATDSQVTDGAFVFGSMQKLYYLKGGAIVALCGSLSLYSAVVDWLDGGVKPEIKEGDNLNGIIVHPDGTFFEISSQLRIFETCIPWAGGSGQNIALAAMRCGKNAAEAVALACEMDIYSGGPVVRDTVNLDI
jgi:ATP-dependent protease HslVU (ClpYQ) peptidase subunit